MGTTFPFLIATPWTVTKVSGFLSATDLNADKTAYVEEFMNRAEFRRLYDPTIGDATAYVDKLLQTANLPNHPGRDGWIAALANNTLTRAQVLRQFIDSPDVYTKSVNEAFIIMNYFGFLRRDADAAYAVWIQIKDAISLIHWVESQASTS